MHVTLTLNDYFPAMSLPPAYYPATAAEMGQPQPTAPVQHDVAAFSEELLLDDLLQAVDYLTSALAAAYAPVESSCPCSAEAVAEASTSAVEGPAARAPKASAAPSASPARSAPAAQVTSPAPARSAPGAGGSATSSTDALDPASFYLTQNQSEYNPEGSINANCGPASLAMAALAFGKNPPGTSKDDPEGLIRAVRKQMTGNEDVHELTGDDDVTRGAQALGMSAAPANSVEAVNAALDAGQMVVAGGDPSAYSSGSGGHFVLITGRSADGGYVMNDPAYTGKPGVVLSPDKFAAFFGGGVAVGP
jgi:hypothetical protein